MTKVMSLDYWNVLICVCLLLASFITPLTMTATTASPSIRKTLRYVEWTILVVSFLVVLTISSGYHSKKISFSLIYACLSACTLLSLIFPANRPLWQKRAYIFIEILLIMLTRTTGWGMDLLLYIVIAKSCFLLSRKDVVIVTGTTGIVWNLILVWSLPGLIEFERSHISEGIAELYDTKLIVIRNLIVDTGMYIAASIFVILLSFVVIAEQKSRAKAIALAQQVETLAATVERTRIARDIHDSLGHTLTTLDVQLELAQRLYQRHPDKALQALNNAKELASQSLAEVRRALQTMRDSHFDLNKALVTLVDQVKQNQSFNIHLPIDN